MGRASCGLLLAVLLLGAGAARADREGSLRHYRAGSEHYDSGRFAEAARRFRAAYAAHPAPEYLFNIAQAHRLLGECDPALEHYLKYLEKAREGKAKELAERHAEALDARCGDSEAAAKDSPRVSADPSEPASELMEPTEPAVKRQTAPPKEKDTTGAPDEPELALNASFGGVLYDIGEIEVPLVASLGAGIAIAVHRDADVRWILGAALELSPMRYVDTAEGTAYLITPHARLGGAMRASPKLWIGAELGVGVLALTGLSDGNPFTTSGANSGTPVLPAARITVSADYELGRELQLALAPLTLSYASRQGRLAGDIDHILGVGASIGLRYSN